MELKEYFRIIRSRWRSIVVVLLVVMAGTALATALMPKAYQAETRLFVSTPGAKDNRMLKNGDEFTQNRVNSYVNVITTRKVLDPVIETLKLDTDAESLAATIKASVPPGTVLIQIAVTNSDARVAVQIADQVGKQFTKTVADLEGVEPSNSSLVRVTVVSAPTVPTKAASPKPASILSLGVMLGLLLGLGLALLRGQNTTIKGNKG